MADREVKIKITGNTSDAQAEFKRLEQESKKTFNEMSDAAKKEAKAVENAFKKSGLRTERDIKKSSLAAQRNYEKIKRSGTASANDIRRAHEVMTAKIKKNNRELRGGNKSIIESFGKLKSKIATIGVVVASAFGIKVPKFKIATFSPRRTIRPLPISSLVNCCSIGVPIPLPRG